MIKRKYFKLLFWHRNLGVSVALLLMLLAVTGFLLNHTDDLELDQSALPSSWLFLYGIERSTVERGFDTGSGWLFAAARQLYVNKTLLGACKPGLVGLVKLPDQQLLAICGEAIYLLTADAEVIEASQQLPEPMQTVQQAGDSFLVTAAISSYQFDSEGFAWQVIEANARPSIKGDVLELQPLPQAVAAALNHELEFTDITWERFLLDLHSGRLFGQFGILVVDFLALALLLLALSGLWVWFGRRR